MNHQRVARAVVAVTGGYVLVLALWLTYFVDGSPEGTIGFQVMFLVCVYGSALGLAMIVAGRPSRSDRRLERHGLEGGWATIRSATPIAHTVDNGGDHRTRPRPDRARVRVVPRTRGLRGAPGIRPGLRAGSGRHHPGRSEEPRPDRAVPVSVLCGFTLA